MALCYDGAARFADCRSSRPDCVEERRAHGERRRRRIRRPAHQSAIKPIRVQLNTVPDSQLENS
jgi:hypothetical protein